MNKPEHLLNGALVGGAIAAIINPVHILVAVPMTATAALLPDIDTHVGTHRKTGHNLFIPALMSLAGVYAAYTLDILIWLVLYPAIGVVSHIALDAICSRRGAALFHPLSETEYNTQGGVTVDDDRTWVVTIGMSVFQVGLFWLFIWPLL